MLHWVDGTVVQFSTFVGVNDNISLIGLSAYPNPTTNTLILTNGNNTNYQASMMNMNGQLVKSFNVASGGNTINVTDLSAGMYTILVSDGKSSYQTKVSIIK
ncbi:MAG: T9SS type A sorting domain-containing protein [Chitinophagaceae bacterium]